MIRATLLISSVFCILYGNVIAQVEPDSLFITSFQKDQLLFNQSNTAYPDTSIDHIHRYFPDYSSFYANNGHFGMPAYSLVFDPVRKAGFTQFTDLNPLYHFNNKSVLYFKNPVPATEVTWVTGFKKEQLFELTHQQNFGNRLNVSGYISNRNLEGFYAAQTLKSTDYGFSSNYTGKKGRYVALASYQHHKAEISENGGILNDTIFEVDTNRITDTIEVKLLDATNFRKGYDLRFSHFVNLGKSIKELKSDSDTVNVSRLNPVARIAHSFSYSKNTNWYKDYDPDSAYYSPLIYHYDEDSIYDSTTVKIMTHDLDFIFLGGDQSPLKFSTGISFQNIDAYLDSLPGNYTNSSFKTQFFLNPKNIDWKFSGNFRYYLNGFNANDFLGSLNAVKLFNNNKQRVTLGITSQKYQIPFDLTFRKSRFLDWDYTFHPTQSFTIKAQWTYIPESLQIGASTSTLTNYVYLDQWLRPRQIQENTQIHQAFIKARLKWGIAELREYAVLQKVSGSDIFGIPPWLSRTTFTLNGGLFKRALIARIGVDLTITDRYYGLGYFPMQRNFHHQRDQIMGLYPFVDYFMNFQIDRARVFIKVAHLNAGFNGYKYYLTQNNPAHERTFNAGVKWLFRN